MSRTSNAAATAKLSRSKPRVLLRSVHLTCQSRTRNAAAIVKRNKKLSQATPNSAKLRLRLISMLMMPT